MKKFKILLVINDIDPNIYTSNIDHTLFKCDILYQKPTSEAMEKKFKVCQQELKFLSWIMVPTKDDLIPKVKEISLNKRYDTIVAFAEDLIIPIEKIKFEMNILNRYSNIKNIQNKYYQRNIVNQKEPKLSGAHWEFCVNDNITSNILKYPVIVKPINKAGSLFVDKINSAKEMNEYLSFLKDKVNVDDTIVVEEYFDGTNWYNKSYERFFDDYVSVESIVSDGCIQHICVSGKPKIATPFRETGLVSPAPLDKNQYNELFKAAEKIIDSLDYKFGPTHIEFKLTSKGPKLIEFNPRAGGPVPYLIQTNSSYPIINNIIKSYLGLDIDSEINFDKVSAFFSFQIGEKDKVQITKINTYNDYLSWKNVNEFFLFRKIGDTITPLLGTSQMIGFAYISVANFEECIKLHSDLVTALNIKYEKVI